MILSTTLLCGFAGYWLRNQYSQEKSSLKESLLQEYYAAREQAMDSVIFNVYIQPVLADSLVFSFGFNSEVDPFSKNRVKELHNKMEIYNGKVLDSTRRDTFFTQSNINIFQHIEVSDSAKPDKIFWNDEEMLLRSFKMVMSQTADNAATDSIIMIRIEDSQIDSLLYGTFTDFIAEKGYTFSSTMLPDSMLTAGQGKSTIVLKAEQGRKKYAIAVSGFQPFLLGRILPQVLFVIFLIGLTVTAFLLTFRTLKKQMELNLLRKDFISNMTHELKTPVATMKVALEALDTFGAGQDPKKTGEYMKIARGEIGRLESLIGRILDHVILEENHTALNMQQVDLKSIVEECLEIIRPAIDEKKAVVNFNKPGEAINIQGDPGYLQSAIINILDNSLKYAGDSPRIDISLSQLKDTVVLEITDNGPGIPEESRARVFEKFFRVSTGDTHNVKGHGLGLSLAALVMKMHGGNITHVTPETGGCRMIMEFPITPDEN